MESLNLLSIHYRSLSFQDKVDKADHEIVIDYVYCQNVIELVI